MSMTSLRIIAATLMSGLLISHTALADSVTVNISGNVVASPCTVESASPLSVVLPDILASDLSANGKVGTKVPFELKLKDCPANTAKVTATYGGTASTLSPNSFKNTGTATALVLLVMDDAGGIIYPNTTRTATVDTKKQTAAFKQTVQIYAKGAVQPGTVIGNIVVSFTYQ